MEQLHPYWRMEYITAPRYPEIERPFSELPALGDDARALIVYRSRLSYLMMNRYPYNPGHLLAIPYREVTDIEELDASERGDLHETLVYAKRLLTAALRPDGFNIGYNLGSAAGGSIAHLHAHIVPRWQGDSNFMPVIGQTRILPQSLEALWARLHEVATTLGEAGNASDGANGAPPDGAAAKSGSAHDSAAAAKQTPDERAASASRAGAKQTAPST